MKVGRSRRIPPARTPKERENQLINLAMDVAQKQLEDGSASSQVITHFLKLGTVREQLENDKLRGQLEMAKAQIDEIQSKRDVKDLYKKAIDAMKLYSGFSGGSEDGR